MVLLIAGPPVEVGVTMYVLSISSVSEVLMVQFAFKLIQNSRHRQLFVRSFVSPSLSRTIPPIPSTYPSYWNAITRTSVFRATQPFRIAMARSTVMSKLCLDTALKRVTSAFNWIDHHVSSVPIIEPMPHHWSNQLTNRATCFRLHSQHHPFYFVYFCARVLSRIFVKIFVPIKKRTVVSFVVRLLYE